MGIFSVPITQGSTHYYILVITMPVVIQMGAIWVGDWVRNVLQTTHLVNDGAGFQPTAVRLQNPNSALRSVSGNINFTMECSLD